jgi:hypothetical protein
MTGGDVWSINPVFDPTGEVGSTVNQAALDAACQAIAALSPGTNALNALSTAVAITGARLEVRDSTNDHLIAISTYTKPSSTAGTSTQKLPPQSAIVVSLRTDTPGPRGRGRIYWPAVGVAMGSTLRISTPTPTALLTDFRTYFLAMASALSTAFPTIGYNLSVRSKVAGATPHVTRLQIGDVIDTQRRRRDAMPESYSTLAM